MTDERIVYLETAEQAAEFWIEFSAGDRQVMAFDTETTGLSVRNGQAVPRIIQFSWRPWNTAVVIDVPDKRVSGEDDWRTRFIEGMVDMADGIIGHNTKFDLHAMYTFGYEWQYKNHHDTMWCARLFDERTGAKLKDLTVRYIDANAADDQKALKAAMKKNGWDWDTIPISELVQYAGNDAIITGKLFDYLYPQIQYAHEAYAREQALSPILFNMERKGLTIDHDLLAKTLIEYEASHAVLWQNLQKFKPGFNPNSPMQIKKILSERGIEVPDTRAPTLAAIRNTGDEFTKALLEYRTVQKTVSTYLRPWKELVKETGRLHPWFNQLGTKTGRFSSSDPNLQNITRGHVLRDMFVAAPGHQIVVADWNQMELRLYAHYAGDEKMIAAFVSGDDIYQQAADMMGVSRQIGKMIMLASIYGAGSRTIKAQARAMALSLDDADMLADVEAHDWDALLEEFHNVYRIRWLTTQCELQARKRLMLDEPYIVTWGGRRMRPKLVNRRGAPMVNGRKPQVAIYKDLANSLVQGGSADLMKEALIDVEKAGYGEYLRLTVHDEMVLEVPDAKVEEVARAIEAIMLRDEFMPPLTADASVAHTYGDAK